MEADTKALTDGSATSSMDPDDLLLQQMGYQPKLHRGLSGLMNFAFGFTEVAVLVSVFYSFTTGFYAGGPSDLIWGFLVTFLMTTIVAYCLAEICAAYPSAGSVYHWSAQLVPREYAALASYTTGLFNFLGNAAGDASFAFAFANFLNAVISQTNGTMQIIENQVGIAICILIVWSLLNFFRIDQVGWINNLAAFIHCSSMIVIVIALLAVPKTLNTGSYVFTQYNNYTGFESKSYVSAVGIVSSLFYFAGYEASAHMAEETGNAGLAAPKGIINTVIATGLGGLALVLALLFSNPLHTPFHNDAGDDFYGPTGTTSCSQMLEALGREWTLGLCILILINCFFAGVSSVAVTGRITFALARDGAFPFSEKLAEVHPYFKSPIWSICFVGFLDICIMMLPLNPDAGNTAFLSIIGLCVIGFQVSYGLPIFFKTIFPKPDFPETPMSLGKFSFPLGCISWIWLFGTNCLYFLPTTYVPGDLNATMNWLFVVVIGVIFLAAVNWFANSQYTFKGPVRHEDTRNLNNLNKDNLAQIEGLNAAREKSIVLEMKSVGV